jgi:hypothetical protein
MRPLSVIGCWNRVSATIGKCIGPQRTGRDGRGVGNGHASRGNDNNNNYPWHIWRSYNVLTSRTRVGPCLLFPRLRFGVGVVGHVRRAVFVVKTPRPFAVGVKCLDVSRRLGRVASHAMLCNDDKQRNTQSLFSKRCCPPPHLPSSPIVKRYLLMEGRCI